MTLKWLTVDEEQLDLHRVPVGGRGEPALVTEVRRKEIFFT